MKTEIKQYIDQLSQLVAAPSISSTQASIDSSNRQVIDVLANWLSDLGFAVDIQTVDEAGGKVNLIATLGEGEGGLVLAGHTDTVPCDPNLWQSDPFSLSVNEHLAFGLGATDMKGFFPTVLQAVAHYQNAPLKHPIIVLATCDEETSMSGARALSKASLNYPRFAVVGEPTGLKPIRMHKGVMMEAIRIKGQSGHSSNPALGNSALDAMSEVLLELKSFRQELQQQYQHTGFDITVPTLNFGCIHGGDNPNRICGHCELEFDLRPLPGMGLDDLRQAIDQRIKPLALRERIQIERVSLFPGIEAFEQEKGSHWVASLEELTGHESESVAFGTEAPFFKALGMDVVVMGPGSIDVAHQPNECIDLRQIDPAVKVIQRLIERYCL